MNKVMKRYVSLIMTLMFVILPVNSVFAMDSQRNNDEIISEEVILKQAMEIDTTGKIVGKEFEVVTLETSEDMFSRNAETKQTTVLQAITINGDMTEVTTVIPYKQLESGELVNSFEYFNSEAQSRVAARPNYPYTKNFVDVSVTVTAYYLREMQSSILVFRHHGVAAYWSSSNNTCAVQSLFVRFRSIGNMHKYPDCYDDLEESLVQYDYDTISWVLISNPVENRTYSDMSHSMPTNRILRVVEYYEHGGWADISITYTVNGERIDDYLSYEVYSKDN